MCHFDVNCQVKVNDLNIAFWLCTYCLAFMSVILTQGFIMIH